MLQWAHFCVLHYVNLSRNNNSNSREFLFSPLAHWFSGTARCAELLGRNRHIGLFEPLRWAAASPQAHLLQRDLWTRLIWQQHSIDRRAFTPSFYSQVPICLPRKDDRLHWPTTVRGIEPRTSRLRGRSSTNWANPWPRIMKAWGLLTIEFNLSLKRHCQSIIAQSNMKVHVYL